MYWICQRFLPVLCFLFLFVSPLYANSLSPVTLNSKKTILQTNEAPVLSSIGNKVVNVGTTLTISLLASDADGDPLTYSTNLIPPGGLFNGNVFAWTPSVDQIGDYSVTFSVNDGRGGADSETILISIIAAPSTTPPQTSQPPVSRPLLSLPTGNHVDLGHVRQGDSATHTLTFVNAGNATLEVIGFISLDRQFSVGNTSMSVPPLTTKDLSITFTPHPDSTAKYEGFERLQARLFFSTNDSNVPTGVITLSAKGYIPIPDPQINVAVSRINFGDVVKVGSTGLITFDVTNTGDTTLVIDQIEGSNQAFSVIPNQATISKGETQKFEVLFQPVSAGDYNTTMTIMSNDPERPIFNIPVQAMAPVNPLPVLYYDINAIDFGTVRTDSTKTWVIQIGNRGQETLRLSLVPNHDLVFQSQVDSLHIAAGEIGELHITFHPDNAVIHSGLLQFLTNDPKHPNFEVSLSGIGKYPPGPRISVFPESINFGEVILGQHKRVTLLLKNLGGQELRAVNLVTNNADFQISQTEIVVASGNEYELAIEFQPTKSDSVIGLLEIPNNDPSKPMVRVPLNALVRVPVGLGRIKPLIDQLTFSEIGLFGQTEVSLPIRNDGVDTLTIFNVVSQDLQVATTPLSAKIPPQGTEVVRVRYRPRPGRAQTGELILNSDDATQPVIYIPWTASVETSSNALSVVSAFPLASGFDVPVQTALSLNFDAPLLVSGQYIALNARLIPQAESGPIIDRFNLEDSNQRVVFPVQLKPDTFYRLVVLSAVGASGATLETGFELGFSTGQTAFDGGEISGRVTFVEDLAFEGDVVVFDEQGRPVGHVPIGADGSYQFTGLPAGSYRVFADVFAEGYGSLSQGYDVGYDGIPDVVDLLVGQHEVGVDVVVLLPGEPVPGSHNLGAKLRFDLDVAVGDQGVVELGAVGAGEDVVVSVYAEDLQDVVGYSLKLHYDSDQVGFVRADGTQEDESNFLSSQGGQAVFITPSPIGGEVELAGAILGVTEAVIPSGNGFLGQFRFVTREGFSGTFFDIAQTVLQSGASRDTVFSTTRALIQTGALPQSGPGEPIPGLIVLDLNPLDGNQGQTVRSGVRAGQILDVQLYADNLPEVTGFGAHLVFDHAALTYVDGSFFAGDFISSGVPLVRDTGVFLDLGVASLQGDSGVGQGLLGHLRFQVEPAFSDSTYVRLTLVGLSLLGGAVEEQEVNVILTLTANGEVPATGDIDGDGQVGFADFLMFARGFATGDMLFDLNADGEVGFGDFLVFAQAFGQGL